MEVQRVIGANILPARVLRPVDKQAVERAFGGIQSLLLEYLLGYRGVDVADRGADPEADAVLTIAEMEHLIATWVVKIWQNRELGEFAPVWDPGGKHSPNTLFAAAMSQGGFSLQIPVPELYYELLPAHHVAVHGDRGVKIRGLWYDGSVLGPRRNSLSARGGRRKGRWVVRSDPRDRRFAYFQDPDTHQWHTLRWTGLPPEGEIPAFGDARAAELLRAAKAAGLKPRSDAELLPLLLELIGGRIPVDAWPAQMPRKKRKDHAREVLQAQAAATDRPEPPPRTAEPGKQRAPSSRCTSRTGGRTGRTRSPRPSTRSGGGAATTPPPESPPPPPPLSSRAAGEPVRAPGTTMPPMARSRDDSGRSAPQAARRGRTSTVPGRASDRPGDAGGLGPVAPRPQVVQSAPVISLGEYKQMSARQRHLHDLHRLATHSNLPIQETPMRAAVDDVMRRRIHVNAVKSSERTRPGLMVNGGGSAARPRRCARPPPASKTTGLTSITTSTPTRSPAPVTSSRLWPTCRPR